MDITSLLIAASISVEVTLDVIESFELMSRPVPTSDASLLAVIELA